MTPDTWIRTWFEEVWNKGDESAIDQLMSVDAIAHGLAGAALRGREAYKPFFHAFRQAFPDIRVEVTRTVTEGAMVCAHCRVTATHRGDGLGAAPTNQRVEFSGITMVRLENGQVQEGWNSFDFLTMYQQIGMLPALAKQ